MKTKTISNRQKIKSRIRKIVEGTAEKPRMTVFRSNKQIYVQIINDEAGKTLVSMSSRHVDISSNSKQIKKVELAKFVGKSIAEKAKNIGITSIVFDRNGYLYHGRIKSLADGAREGGLKF